MLLANLFILIIGLLGIKYFIKILSVPKAILSPLILVLCVVGSYALNNNYFDVMVMFLAGVIGYFMVKLEFPVSPVILGLILGPIMESNFRRSLLMSQGNLAVFYTRPITLVLLIFALVTLLGPIISKLIKISKGKEIINENN
jgi:putative tricarboxylic transport membrane protein